MPQSSYLFNKFPKANISDWVKVAEKELNGKPLESLIYHYNNEITMPPMVFSGNEDKKMNPIVWRKNHVCQRGISFRYTENLKEENIEFFISIGINNFKLNVTEKSMIQADELKRLFPSCHWLDVQQEERKPSDFVIQQILDNFQQAISLIQSLKINEEPINEFLGSIHFSREIQDNYLYEISLGRAQRIVWRNILKAFEIDNPAPPLFISTLPVIKNGLHDHFLIEATTKMLSAILGGSDIIYLELDEINEEMRIENIAHIYHIFTLESDIGKVIDPAAGSFYLDKLTTKLAQQIWSKLKP
jgi:hypothetical protein